MGLLSKWRPTDDERKRTPPGQHLVRDFPVLHAGSIPYRSIPKDWSFHVFGEVEAPVTLTIDEFQALPRVERTVDIHCVTSWSKLDTRWEGVSIGWVLAHCRPRANATHVIAHAEEDYTANVPLEILSDDDVLLADRFDGMPLTPEHGFPLRLVVPSRYFWKSAKWLRGLEFVDSDRPGFWENYGYSMSADPWNEERYAF